MEQPNSEYESGPNINFGLFGWWFICTANTQNHLFGKVLISSANQTPNNDWIFFFFFTISYHLYTKMRILNMSNTLCVYMCIYICYIMYQCRFVEFSWAVRCISLSCTPHTIRSWWCLKAQWHTSINGLITWITRDEFCHHSNFKPL